MWRAIDKEKKHTLCDDTQSIPVRNRAYLYPCHGRNVVYLYKYHGRQRIWEEEVSLASANYAAA